MPFIVSSNSVPMLLSSSSTVATGKTIKRKEVIKSTTDHSTNAINSNSILLMRDYHYSTTTTAAAEGLIPSFREEEETKQNLPTLYDMNGVLQDGSAVETEEEEEEEEEEENDDDTEDEQEDSDDDLLASIFSAFNEKIKEQTTSTPPPAFSSSSLIPVVDASASTADAAACRKANNQPQKSALSSSLSLSTIRIYSPQLNFSLYSPTITTPITPSVFCKDYRNFTSGDNRAAAPSNTLKTSSSCLIDTFSTTTPAPSTGHYNINKKAPPLTSSTSYYTPSATKMDIRSPPQPTPSSSRFINAFQRFRNSSSSSHQHHKSNHFGSVVPAEIVSSIKPTPSKSSLADRIKHKFQYRKSTKTTTSSDENDTIKKKSLSQKPNFSMSRSASLSSITHWTRHKSVSPAISTMPLPPVKSIDFSNRKSFTSQHQFPHSLSVTSFNNNKRTLTRSPSSSSSFSYDEIINTPSSFSLTKSISSHRLYNNNNNKNSNHSNSNHSNSNHSNSRDSNSRSSSSSSSSNSSSNNGSSSSRPKRHPLRAVNPNDSVRLSLQQQQKSNKTAKQVQFTKLISVRETWSKKDYDRGSDPEAMCSRLTPLMAQHIKEELNAYKLHEMQVHEYSRVYTHFFI